MIRVFNELESTNTYGLDEYQNFNNLDVIYALKQTKGRGRLGRSWVSEDSLAMSILLKDDLNFDISLLSFIAASSVFNIVKKHTKNVSIKWPNDILVNDKKICGILCQSRFENDTLKALVVGIGLNTNNKEFFDELNDKATSLYILNNTYYNNMDFAKEIYEEFISLYSDFRNGINTYYDIIINNNYLLNKEVIFIYQNKECVGKVIGIDKNCKLIISYDEKEIALNTGEVLLKNAYK